MSSATAHDVGQQRTIDLVIRLVVLGGLLAWCFLILRPFLMLIVWAGIIAVALHTPYESLQARLGQRRRSAAALSALALLAAFLVPAALLGGSLFDGARYLASEGLQVPPPPEGVEGWPLIGGKLAALWSAASENLGAALERFQPQLKGAGTWLLAAVASSGLVALELALSAVLATAILVQAPSMRAAVHALTIRLAGDQRGPEIADLARDTVRSVARGVVGVALIQTLMLGLGFFVAGIPGAGLLALACLILSVVQIGPGLISLPVLIYAFSQDGAGVGTVVFAVWTVVGTLVDTPLKPILMGRGAPAPMPVIFLGALGGMLSFGIIGLFAGAVVLCVGFRLYQAWLDADPAQQAKAEAGPEATPIPAT